MPGPVIRDPIPAWLKPENASVFDSALQKAIRQIASIIGANDAQQQVLGMMAPMETDAAGGLVGAVQKIMKGIKAYHGSPHDFEKFDISKIGTGEGAQAYGHGLYFAENPATAEEYKRQLQQFRLPSLGNEENEALDPLIRRSISGSRAEAERALAAMEGNPYYDRARAAIQKHIAAGAPTGSVQGKMYEVQINAHPDQFLDWDKPLSQQSPQVQDAFWAAYKQSWGKTAGQRPDLWEAGLRARQQEVKDGATAAQLYSQLGDNEKHASRLLRRAGIPGIKYLDQGSRAAGEGSRNYVVFDDSLITILKKYGVALPVIESLRRKAAAMNGTVPESDLQSAIGTP